MQWIEDMFADVAGSAVEKLVLFLAAWIVQVLTQMVNFVGTWWLKIGAPSMGNGSATERIQDSTVVFVGVAGVIGTVFALIKLARDQDRASAENLVMGMLRTVLTSAIAVSMVSLLLTVTDEVAPWLVRTISGSAWEDGLGTAMGLDALVGAGMTVVFAGLIIFIAPLALLGAILNAVLVIFSYGMAGALCGLLPIFAASSVTERGRKSFDKAVGWLIAVVLFKPAAAVLYGFGLAMVNGITGTADSEEMNRVISLLTGLVIILSACIAMPALARVMVPAVSAGPQGMGASGLAMLGGAVAVGALTGGLGAGAGAAAAGGGAASGGAATTGAAAAADAGASTTGAAAAEAGATTTGTAGAEVGSSTSGMGKAESGAGTPSTAGTSPADGGGGGTSGGTGTAGGGTGGGTGGATSGGSAGATSAQTPPDASSSTGVPEAPAAPGSSDNSGSSTLQGAHASTEAPNTGAPPQTSVPTGAGPEPADSSQAPATPQQPADSPTAEGFKNSSPDGAGFNAMMNQQRLEYALREAAKDAENSIESKGDA